MKLQLFLKLKCNPFLICNQNIILKTFIKSIISPWEVGLTFVSVAKQNLSMLFAKYDNPYNFL